MEESKQMLKTEMKKDISLPYLLYLPDGYDPESKKEWPLVLFLHGMGERGNDLEIVKKHGLPKRIEEGAGFPFIVVAPQCSVFSEWVFELDALQSLMRTIIDGHHVDESRIYLTGLSMGGAGTWSFAEANPRLFAAIVPICGYANSKIGFPERIKVLKDVPVWAFHGEADDVVPFQSSVELVDELSKCNGAVKFTSYPGVNHDSWTETYENPDLYDWLLQHKKQ